MEDIEASATVEKSSHIRTSQACQRCRSLKTRCLPSERLGTCQRCFTAKRDCAWAETPRRPKRTRGPSRIAQVEQKIDGLVSRLVVSRAPDDTTPPTDPLPDQRNGDLDWTLSEQSRSNPGGCTQLPSLVPVQPSRPDTDVDGSQRFLDKLREIHNFGDDVDLTRPPTFKPPQLKETMIDNELVGSLLSSGKADSLLGIYRTMIESSPFVPIPHHVSAFELSSTKPMLFLAVLTVASWQDHQQQLALDRLYRTELAQRTIIQPRRTLSLLQSLVVYLSWYHFVFSHKTQQTVTLLQLAIGLALDLNLHQRSKRLPIDFPGRPPAQEPGAAEQRERQRTYLGCYHLSSALASGLVKPNLLRYSEYMASCGKKLKEDLEYPTDELIARLIPLRRIDDQAQEAFYSEETFDLPFTDSRIFMSLRFLETQMDDWRRENVSDKFRQALDLSYAFAEMQLYSIGLRPPPPSLNWQPADSNQLKALLSALEAGKRFFDILLAFPASDYHLIPFSEWMRIPFAVITVSRLCIPSDAHAAMQWDVKAAQERVRLDLYLESLCYRMQGLSTYDKAKQPHPDFWWAMRMIMDLTRTWYVRKIKGGKVPTPSSTSHNFPTPDTMQTSSSAGPGCIMSPGDGSNVFSLPGVQGATNGMAGHSEHIIDPVHDGGNDPFAFMRSMDFDMDQFLDMGIWGHDSYEAMGFGGGNTSHP